MARESEEETYRRLHAKYGGQAEPDDEDDDEPDDEDGPDDEGIFVLSGRHADGFLDRLFGPPAKPKTGKRRTAAPEPEDEELDDDQGADDAPTEDPRPARADHGFFRQSRRG